MIWSCDTDGMVRSWVCVGGPPVDDLKKEVQTLRSEVQRRAPFSESQLRAFLSEKRDEMKQLQREHLLERTQSNDRATLLLVGKVHRGVSGDGSGAVREGAQ